MIIEREKVLEAYARARRLGATQEEAIASVAQALGVAEEVVAECVTEAVGA